MATVIKAPDVVDTRSPRVFMAGSIEMGLAEPWQDRLVNMTSDLDLTFLNPRRTEWDSTWEQSIHNAKFFEQVSWELAGLETSEAIVFYFDPATKSPITLMELGLVAGRSCEDPLLSQIIVCCPTGFWRKGNVDIVCNRYSIPVVDSLEGIADWLRTNYNDLDLKAQLNTFWR